MSTFNSGHVSKKFNFQLSKFQNFQLLTVKISKLSTFNCQNFQLSTGLRKHIFRVRAVEAGGQEHLRRASHPGGRGQEVSRVERQNRQTNDRNRRSGKIEI
jgi:hypothetical protein